MSEAPQKTKNQKIIQLAGSCGILGSVLPLIMVLSATILSSSFSWSVNALSDLGVGEQAMLFNSAVIMGGVLNLIFAVGLLRSSFTQKKIALVGASLIVAGSIGLALVGVFTINYLIYHGIAAFAYFILVPMGILLIGKDVQQKGIKTLSFACGIIALFAILILPILFFYLPLSVGFAVPELIESLTILCWTIPISIRLIKTG